MMSSQFIAYLPCDEVEVDGRLGLFPASRHLRSFSLAIASLLASDLPLFSPGGIFIPSVVNLHLNYSTSQNKIQ